MKFTLKPLVLALPLCSPMIFNHALAQESTIAGLVEEIIVTATKRETRLMETPIAITAITTEQLQRQGINNVRNLAGLIPNLDIGFDQDQSAPVISMRGVRSTNTTELGDPSVGLHMDGIFSPRPQGAMAMLFDVERIEALRGPQGTLYGRNSTVGVVNVISKRPDLSEFSGTFRAEGGSWNHQLLQGAVNIPLSDTFAVRAAVAHDIRDSYLTGYYDANQYDRRRLPQSAQQAPFLAGDAYSWIQPRAWWTESRELMPANPSEFYNNVDQTAWRLTGLWQPTDTFSWMLTAEGYQDSSAGNINTIDCEKLERRPGDDTCASYYGPGADEYTVAINTPGNLDLSIQSYRSNVSWDFRDDMTLVYNAGFALQERSNLIDIDAGVTDWDMELWFVDTDYKSQSHEIQLQSTGDRDLDWIVGAFYFKEDNDMNGLFNAHLDNSVFWDQPARVLQSQALFGQANYAVTDRMDVTLGYRYTEDTKQDTGGRNLGCNRDWSLGPDAEGFPGCYPAYINDFFNALPVDHFSNPDIYSTNTNNDFKNTWSSSNFRLGLDYELTEDVFLYAYVADGFKSGGFGDVNIEYLQDPVTAEYPLDDDGNRIIEQIHQSDYLPEDVITYEIGAKGTFLDGDLTASATYFFSDYQNIQLAQPESVYDIYSEDMNPNSDTFGEIITNGVIVYNTRNAAEADISGLEFEFTWTPFEDGVFKGYGTWLDTEITSDFVTRWNFNNQPLFDIADFGAAHSNENEDLYRNLKGNELAVSPNFAFTVNYAHTFNFSNGSKLVPYINVHWEDDSYLTHWNVDKHEFAIEDTSPYNDTREAFTTVDVSVKWISPDDSLEIEAFGYNVTDQVIFYWAAGNDNLVRGPASVPANYGLRMIYNL